MGTLKGKTALQIFKQFPYLKDKAYWGGITFGQKVTVLILLELMQKSKPRSMNVDFYFNKKLLSCFYY